jgi:hypothetical protein
MTSGDSRAGTIEQVPVGYPRLVGDVVGRSDACRGYRVTFKCTDGENESVGLFSSIGFWVQIHASEYCLWLQDRLYRLI